MRAFGTCGKANEIKNKLPPRGCPWPLHCLKRSVVQLAQSQPQLLAACRTYTRPGHVTFECTGSENMQASYTEAKATSIVLVPATRSGRTGVL